MKKGKNTRFTRRSYKRRMIMFGVSIFMSLALSATGFAAWVISKDADNKAEGAVEIGAVTEASVEITDIQFIGDNNAVSENAKDKSFIFEPLESDMLGRVRYDGKSLPENLDVEFTWKVSNFQIVGDLFVDFKLPVEVYTAIEKNWIALPEQFEILDGVEEIPSGDTKNNYKVARYVIQNTATENAKKVDPNGMGYSDGDGILKYSVNKTADDIITDVTFTMKIAFEWGSEFDGMNPGIYYDTEFMNEPSKGADIKPEIVKATLNEFKATLHGITYNAEFEAKSEAEKAEAYEASPIDKFYVEINAQVA